MISEDLMRRASVARAEMGAHKAFLLSDPNRFHVVESGYVDLFAVVSENLQNREILARKPFVARIMPGKAFFEPPYLRNFDTKVDAAREKGYFLMQAVPSRDAVVVSGDRNEFATPGNFDLEVVTLIDDWVYTASRFVSAYEKHMPTRDVRLLDADPEVPYAAETVMSAHHLETLWVTSDRPANFVGREVFPIASGKALPLTEHTWFTLSEDARVSATHTPGIIIEGRLWEAMDRFNEQILRCGEVYWLEYCDRAEHYSTRREQANMAAERLMMRNLTALLTDPSSARRGVVDAQRADSSFEAAAIVAESLGVKLERAHSPGGDDIFEDIRSTVESSGVLTRRITLSPGWEKRDGPSFVGLVDDDEPRPVAIVNHGRGAYKFHDPANVEAVPLNRELAETLETSGLMLYAPLPEKIKTGPAALLHVLRDRSRDIWGLVLMGCLAAVLALLTPVVTGKLLAEIIPRVDIPMWAAALSALAVGAVTTSAFSIVGALYMLRIEARVDETLQAAVWNRLLSLPLPFFRRFLAGDLADRANGVSVVRQLLTGATSSSILSGVFSIFSYALLFYYSWMLALWAGAMVLLVAAATWFFAVQQIRHTRKAFTMQGLIDGYVFQIIRGIAKLRQANAESHALENWSELFAKQKSSQLSARQWGAGQLAFNAMVGPAVQILLLALIWYSLLQGENPSSFALGDFLSFNAAFGQFVGGVTGLTAALVTVVSALPLFERIKPILETAPESSRGRVDLPRLAGRIEFRNVSFRYPSATSNALDGVSFQIEEGEYVAFVGASGAGKSTVYRLLLGFESPDTGTVLMDGHDLTSLKLSSLRNQMGVVLQHGQLTPDSIENNISGEAKISQTEIWEAVRKVGLEEEIKVLPMRLKTLLSEAGSGLSGGQKQRLLIARALARKPSILLFDEATSMLDNRSQDIIRKTLREMTGTRVLIAHRLSTVVDADRIYVMRDGNIVESGKYEELMRRDGVMAELARRQII